MKDEKKEAVKDGVSKPKKCMKWLWIHRMAMAAAWLIGSIAATGITMYLAWEVFCPTSIVGKMVCVASAVLVVLLAVHFVHCFTRNLQGRIGEENGKTSKLRAIFVYAYVFQLIAIGASLALFLLPPDVRFSSSLSKHGSWAGIKYACVRVEGGGQSDLTRCENGSSDHQWLLHIGSGVLLARTGTNSEEPEEETEEEPEGIRHTELSRGLVVPLYVVVIAIIGGAVGMTRRLPEIQKAAESSNQQEQAKPNNQKNNRCSCTEVARERVVFQIMQMLSAPLIAIASFAAFEPDSVTVAVLIGFSSGFASETILKGLRNASKAVVGNDQRGKTKSSRTG